MYKQMETIQELSERIDGLVSSIEQNDIDKEEFLSHKYMIISLHAHTERAKLDAERMSSAQKMAIKKQYNLYCSLEELFKKKAHTYTAREMYTIILKAQNMINMASNENT